jgi:uncharacterized protein
MDTKFTRLTEILRQSDQILVAFSAGVDSTFLLKAAHLALGDSAVALTASSASVPPGELDAAKSFAASLGCQHIVLDSHEIDNPAYAENPVNRCFFCKDELYRICRAQAEKLTTPFTTNLDDLKDHRPTAPRNNGASATRSSAAMTKDDIRRYSRELNLPTWDKPSSPAVVTLSLWYRHRCR